MDSKVPNFPGPDMLANLWTGEVVLLSWRKLLSSSLLLLRLCIFRMDAETDAFGKHYRGKSLSTPPYELWFSGNRAESMIPNRTSIVDLVNTA